MTRNYSNINDDRLEFLLGNLLKIGVIISCVITVFGAVLFLLQHGFETPNYHIFEPQTFNFSNLSGCLAKIIALQPESIMELGLLILITTPVLRVFLSIIAYSIQKDFMYFLFSLFVFLVMVYGFLS